MFDSLADMTVQLKGSDPVWVSGAGHDELRAALAEAACAQKVVDAAMTLCRRELQRRAEPGCGQAASVDIEVAHRTGESALVARRHRRRADVADRYDAAAARLAAGEIGGEHLDAVAAVVPAELADAVDQQQDGLFADAAQQTPDEFRDRLRDFVRAEERQRGIDRAEQQRRCRNGRVRTNPRTGMTEVHAELAPLQGAPVSTRLRAELRRLLAEDQADPRSTRLTTQQWADAITHVILAGGAERRSTTGCPATPPAS